MGWLSLCLFLHSIPKNSRRSSFPICKGGGDLWVVFVFHDVDYTYISVQLREYSIKAKKKWVTNWAFFSSRTINILWAFSFEHKDIIHFHSFNSAVASCHYDRPKMTSCTQNLWIPWHSTPLLFISGNFLVGQLTWKWKNRQLQSKQWHLQPKPNSVGFHWELPYLFISSLSHHLSLHLNFAFKYLFKVIINSWSLK